MRQFVQQNVKNHSLRQVACYCGKIIKVVFERARKLLVFSDWLKSTVHFKSSFRHIKKHQSFFKYTWVGVIVTVLTIVLSSLFIDVFSFPAWIVNTVVIGGFFILKYFLYKWVGFAK